MSKKYPCPAGREDDCGYPACSHDRQCELERELDQAVKVRMREHARQKDQKRPMTTHSQEWQPIETAPTDGTKFFAYDTLGNPHLVEYCRVYCQFEGTQGEWIYPTHWMPLPEPPTEDEREQP